MNAVANCAALTVYCQALLLLLLLFHLRDEAEVESVATAQWQ